MLGRCFFENRSLHQEGSQITFTCDLLSILELSKMRLRKMKRLFQRHSLLMEEPISNFNCYLVISCLQESFQEVIEGCSSTTHLCSHILLDKRDVTARKELSALHFNFVSQNPGYVVQWLQAITILSIDSQKHIHSCDNSVCHLPSLFKRKLNGLAQLN